MTGRGLEDRLVSSGALRREAVQVARRRQRVYGGGLDTVLLEMGLVDEGTLWALLVEESGLPPLPLALLEGPIVEPDLLLGATEAKRLGAFLFQSGGGGTERIVAVARPAFEATELGKRIQGRPCDVFIVPEVRFEALLGAFYAQAIPPRFVSLLGRLMGAEQLRRWAAARTPRHHLPTAPVDVGPRVLPKATVAPTPPMLPAPLLQPVQEPPIEALPQPPPEEAAAAPPTAEPIETHKAPAERDELLAALTWLAELSGGPRAASVAETIARQWTSDDIFARLPQLARRGEDTARAALPVLARQGALGLLSDKLKANAGRDRAWAALGLGMMLQTRGDAQSIELAGQAMRLLCGTIEHDPDPDVRGSAARGLRGLAKAPGVNRLVTRLGALVSDPSALDPARVGAALLLGEMRADNIEAMDGLIAGTAAKSQAVANTCHMALLRITGHDPGRGRSRWRTWWKRHAMLSRPGWLIAALDSRRSDLRLAAINELTELSGENFGFHFDLTLGPRRAAVDRWKVWLETRGP